MKWLLRRLTRVADSSQMRAEGKGGIGGGGRRRWKGGRGRRRRWWWGGRRGKEGQVPVYVGEEMERFAVPAEMLGRPAFVELLRCAAAEYGYEQPGILRIPCPVPVFLSVLRSLSDDNPRDDNARGGGGAASDPAADYLFPTWCFPNRAGNCTTTSDLRPRHRAGNCTKRPGWA